MKMILKGLSLAQLRYLSQYGPWPFVATEGDVYWPDLNDVQLFDALWERRHSHHARALLRKLGKEVRQAEKEHRNDNGAHVRLGATQGPEKPRLHRLP